MSLAFHDIAQPTPIQYLGNIFDNQLWMKREDALAFCFGGNKARKAQLFFREIDSGAYNAVVTYGSGSSNHCRVVANMAAARTMPCYIISPEEASEETFNTAMMRLFHAEITVCPVEQVSLTIDHVLATLRMQGLKPYFIPGGGHGNIGTQAFVDCYEEIKAYEKEKHVHFDFIFHASGTGTTQAGLVCGQLINRDNRKIVGISIARKKERGRMVVLESIKDYLCEHKVDVPSDILEETTVFLDDYVGGGYGSDSSTVNRTVQNVMTQYGIPMDSTYTGKAFAGMLDYIENNQLNRKNILFIHTGGTPLYFDYLNKIENLEGRGQ